MARKHGKKLQLWMSADADTAPTVNDLVPHITGINFSGRANISNGTAAGDDWAVKAGGIPDASIRITGRCTFEEGDDRLFVAFTDQVKRQFFVVYDADTPSERLEFVAILAEITRTAQHTSYIDWSIALEIDGPVADPRAAAA